MTNDAPRSLAELAHGGDIAMFTTIDGDRPTSRPLTVAEVSGGVVSFLVDVTAPWMAQLDSDPVVNVAIAAGGRNDWVSVTGRAAVSADRATIERLWSPAAGAYFDGVDDPNIRALAVAVDEGEYWTAPSGGPIGRIISLVGTALGKGAATGGHGDVSRD